MHRTQRILMVAFVATALTADRFAAAAPSVRPQISEAARRLAARLVVSFRQTASAVALQTLTRSERPGQIQRVHSVPPAPIATPFADSPSEYRLPPPAC